MRKIHVLLAFLLLLAIPVVASAKPSGNKPPGGTLSGREIVTQTYWNETAEDDFPTVTASCPSGKVATGGSAQVLFRLDSTGETSPRLDVPTPTVIDAASFTASARLAAQAGSTGTIFTRGLEVRVVCVIGS